ncbi:MAG TPA: rhomboid family intramembrane serine protease [Flavobacterium sp.]|nr:rhomboid family intramembrane serine protease [Flavobacterium sp.]
MMQMTPVVKQLLILNIIMFVGCGLIQNADSWFALYYVENPAFKIWQVVTHMFMHGSVMHIAFNMFALYSFGGYLEHFWGARRFTFFYLSCGLGAALVHTLANGYFFHEGLDLLLQNGFAKKDIIELLSNGEYDKRWTDVLGKDGFDRFAGAFVSPAVGASGAIYGLLAAFALMFPNAELFIMFIPIPVKAKYVVPGLIALDVLGGVSKYSVMGSNIAHFAHIGGAIFGVIIMWAWRNSKYNHRRWN